MALTNAPLQRGELRQRPALAKAACEPHQPVEPRQALRRPELHRTVERLGVTSGRSSEPLSPLLLRNVSISDLLPVRSAELRGVREPLAGREVAVAVVTREVGVGLPLGLRLGDLGVADELTVVVEARVLVHHLEPDAAVDEFVRVDEMHCVLLQI